MNTHSWWIAQPSAGFTEMAAQAMKVRVPIDCTEAEHRAFVQRAHLLSALQALRLNKKAVGLCHANVVGKH